MMLRRLALGEKFTPPSATPLSRPAMKYLDQHVPDFPDIAAAVIAHQSNASRQISRVTYQTIGLVLIAVVLIPATAVSSYITPRFSSYSTPRSGSACMAPSREHSRQRYGCSAGATSSRYRACWPSPTKPARHGRTSSLVTIIESRRRPHYTRCWRGA